MKVIKCKDCSYYENGKYSIAYCRHINGLKGVKPTDFCSWVKEMNLTMAKYINADEFVANLDMIGHPVGEFATDDYIDGFSDGVSAAMKYLETMSNEDVVKIVRCKECKYYSKMYKLCSCRSDRFNVYLNEDDYCSRGVRK